MLTGDKIKAGMPQARFVRAISGKAAQFKTDRMPGARVVCNLKPTAETMQGHGEYEFVAVPLNAYNPNPLGGFRKIQL